jgi:hypothetical protein
MSFARTLLKELRKLFGPVSAEPAPAPIQRQLAQDWIAQKPLLVTFAGV